MSGEFRTLIENMEVREKLNKVVTALPVNCLAISNRLKDHEAKEIASDLRKATKKLIPLVNRLLLHNEHEYSKLALSIRGCLNVMTLNIPILMIPTALWHGDDRKLVDDTAEYARFLVELLKEFTESSRPTGHAATIRHN